MGWIHKSIPFFSHQSYSIDSILSSTAKILRRTPCLVSGLPLIFSSLAAKMHTSHFQRGVQYESCVFLASPPHSVSYFLCHMAFAFILFAQYGQLLTVITLFCLTNWIGAASSLQIGVLLQSYCVWSSVCGMHKGNDIISRTCSLPPHSVQQWSHIGSQPALCLVATSVKYRVTNRCKSYTVAQRLKVMATVYLSAVVVMRITNIDCSPDHDRISMGVLDARLPPTARRWGQKMTNGWGATFAAACRTSTCCEMSCAQAFRGGCVKTHGTLVRASAASWYVRCCRNVRMHALHDINFCHWAHGGDNLTSCFAQFDKPYEMTRGQVCYAMQARSVSRTRFTVIFQWYTKWPTLSKPWISSILAHKLAETTCKSMKIYCTSCSTSSTYSMVTCLIKHFAWFWIASLKPCILLQCVMHGSL